MTREEAQERLAAIFALCDAAWLYAGTPDDAMLAELRAAAMAYAPHHVP